MSKLMVGDIFRYKGCGYDFTAELVKKTKDIFNKELWNYEEKIISGNFLEPGRMGRSNSNEDEYITILKKNITIENLKTESKNGKKIELNIRKTK